jgi:hypothetical protein
MKRINHLKAIQLTVQYIVAKCDYLSFKQSYAPGNNIHMIILNYKKIIEAEVCVHYFSFYIALG